MKKIPIIFISLFYSTIIYANECSEILQYSQTTSRVVSSKSDFESRVKDFCKEYSSNKSSAKNLGIKYKFLSFSSGSNSASSIASKYCSNDEYKKTKDSDFDSYVKYIDPRAYTAYIQCKQLSTELTYTTTKLARKLVVHVTFNPKYKNTITDLTYSTISDDDTVKCKWKDTGKSKITIGQDTIDLECRRSEKYQNKLSYISISRKGVGELAIKIPWSAYKIGEDNAPINTLKQLRGKIESVEQKLNIKTIKLEETQKKLKSKLRVNAKNINNIGIIDILDTRFLVISDEVHTLNNGKKFTDYRNIIVCSLNGSGYTENCRLIDTSFTGYTYLDSVRRRGRQWYETKFKIIGNNQYKYSHKEGHSQDNKLYLIQGLHKKAL